ncbi:MAG: peptide deformylase [Clostridia bacterium]|nr:peptide deformylase [Clostridia bacterium]
MAIRKIVQIGDEVLRKRCFEVSDFGEKTKQLLDDMRDTLIKAEGAGLAAPQVGVLRRIFIVDVDGEYYEMLNPVILEQSGKQYGVEGCLSVVGKWGDVERPKKLKVKYQDRNGNYKTLVAEDFLAKAICHENDHLNGVLYVDKADNLRTEV